MADEENARRIAEQGKLKKVKKLQTQEDKLDVARGLSIKKGVKFHNPMNDSEDGSEDDSSSEDEFAPLKLDAKPTATQDSTPSVELMEKEKAIQQSGSVAAAAGLQLKVMQPHQLEQVLQSIKARPPLASPGCIAPPCIIDMQH